MKVFFPRNISGSWLNMSIQIGPATVSVLQLVILALGMGLSMVLRNQLVQRNFDKGIAFFIAFPVLLFFIIIAFFRYSELRLHEFIAKMIQTHILNVTRKFQINHESLDPLQLMITKNNTTDHLQQNQEKILEIDTEKLKTLRGL